MIFAFLLVHVCHKHLPICFKPWWAVCFSTDWPQLSMFCNGLAWNILPLVFLLKLSNGINAGQQLSFFWFSSVLHHHIVLQLQVHNFVIGTVQCAPKHTIVKHFDPFACRNCCFHRREMFQLVRPSSKANTGEADLQARKVDACGQLK